MSLLREQNDTYKFHQQKSPNIAENNNNNTNSVHEQNYLLQDWAVKQLEAVTEPNPDEVIEIDEDSQSIGSSIVLNTNFSSQTFENYLNSCCEVKRADHNVGFVKRRVLNKDILAPEKPDLDEKNLLSFRLGLLLQQSPIYTPGSPNKPHLVTPSASAVEDYPEPRYHPSSPRYSPSPTIILPVSPHGSKCIGEGSPRASSLIEVSEKSITSLECIEPKTSSLSNLGCKENKYLKNSANSVAE